MRVADVVAIVLAAGMSTRMGAPKMLLPWKDSTVIQAVLSALHAAGIENIIVVLGAAEKEISDLLKQLPMNVLTASNPNYQNGEMTDSIKVGVAAAPVNARAALIALGDQPQIEVETIRAILLRYTQKRSSLIVPSYQMRRGHPWLVDRALWSDLFSLSPQFTMRDFMHKYSEKIDYLVVDTATILQDLDTPEEYARFRSEGDQGAD